MKVPKNAVTNERHGVVPYGASVTFHRITCTSQVVGITCRMQGGSGIFISEESVRRR